MLDLTNENTAFIYKVPQEHIANNYVSMVGLSQQFSHFCIDWSYSHHLMSVYYFTLGQMIDTGETQ